MAKFVESKPPQMTGLLWQAFLRASEEFPDYEQDEFARWLLDEIELDNARWGAALNVSDSSNPEGYLKLKKLADRALADIREGRAEPLDPKKL
jgi:hypothetical protein